MKKKIFIILGALVAIVAAYMVLYPGKNPFKKAANLPTPTPAAPGDTSTKSNGIFSPSASAGNQPEGFPLYPDPYTFKQDVAYVQSTLNTYFGSSLIVDGLFGPKTLAALKAHGFATEGYLTFEEFEGFQMQNMDA